MTKLAYSDCQTFARTDLNKIAARARARARKIAGKQFPFGVDWQIAVNLFAKAAQSFLHTRLWQVPHITRGQIKNTLCLSDIQYDRACRTQENCPYFKDNTSTFANKDVIQFFYYGNN